MTPNTWLWPNFYLQRLYDLPTLHEQLHHLPSVGSQRRRSSALPGCWYALQLWLSQKLSHTILYHNIQSLLANLCADLPPPRGRTLDRPPVNTLPPCLSNPILSLTFFSNTKILFCLLLFEVSTVQDYPFCFEGPV